MLGQSERLRLTLLTAEQTFEAQPVLISCSWVVRYNGHGVCTLSHYSRRAHSALLRRRGKLVGCLARNVQSLKTYSSTFGCHSSHFCLDCKYVNPALSLAGQPAHLLPQNALRPAGKPLKGLWRLRGLLRLKQRTRRLPVYWVQQLMPSHCPYPHLTQIYIQFSGCQLILIVIVQPLKHTIHCDTAGLLTGGRAAQSSTSPEQEPSDTLPPAPALPSRPHQAPTTDLPKLPNAVANAPAKPKQAAASADVNAAEARQPQAPSGTGAQVTVKAFGDRQNAAAATAKPSADTMPLRAVQHAVLAPAEPAVSADPKGIAGTAGAADASRPPTLVTDMDIEADQPIALPSNTLRSDHVPGSAVAPEALQSGIAAAQPSTTAAAAATPAATGLLPIAASAASVVQTPLAASQLAAPVITPSGPPAVAPVPQLGPPPPQPTAQQADFLQQAYISLQQQQMWNSTQCGAYPYTDQQFMAAQGYGGYPLTTHPFGPPPFMAIPAVAPIPGPQPPPGETLVCEMSVQWLSACCWPRPGV